MIAPIPPVSAGAIGGIGGVGGVRGVGSAAKPAAPGFSDAIAKGLEQVSELENSADAVTRDIASGGPSQIHDLMIATTKASVGVDMLVQVRNRAVEAYQEVMRMPL